MKAKKHANRKEDKVKSRCGSTKLTTPLKTGRPPCFVQKKNFGVGKKWRRRKRASEDSSHM